MDAIRSKPRPEEESQGQKPGDIFSKDSYTHPDISVFNLEVDCLVSPFGSVQTPPVLPLQGKSFLFLPKMDARHRLTSTPNQNAFRLKSELDACEFSPTGDTSEHSIVKRLPIYNQEEELADIKSVLFPACDMLQRDAPCIFPVESDKKRKRSQSADRSTLSREAKPRPHCGSISSSKNYPRDRMEDHDASLQDSGIGSLAVSTNSAASSFQHQPFTVSSPMKRRAENTEACLALESPMKRLAFMSFESCRESFRDDNSSNERPDTIDISQPGSLFLLDRSNANESTFATELSPLTPVFANAISFSPPKERKSHFIADTASNDFQFAKPLRPCKKAWDSRKSIKSRLVQFDEPVVGSNVGVCNFDIIAGLAERDLHHVIQEIFATVRKKDVLRCSRVSQCWAKICGENPFLKRQIKSLKKEYRSEEVSRGSENVTAKEAMDNALLKSPAKTGSFRDLSSGRSALCNLQTRAKRTPTKKVLFMPTTPSGKNRFVPADDKFQHNQAVKRTLQFGEKLRPCPMCGWTAKIYGGNSNKGLCYRIECRYAFCTMCKSAYHSPEKCRTRTMGHSPAREAVPRGNTIGTKKSKQRLKKRLLM